MHSSLFLLLGLTISCSAQFPDLTAEVAEDTVPQITSPNNAETGVDKIDDGVGTVDSGSDSPDALTDSQTDNNQLCFLNNNNQTPSKRRLRVREWCRNNEYNLSPKNPPETDTKPPATTPQEGEPNEGSAADGNLNNPSSEQNRIGRPRTSKPLELPPIPGRTPSSLDRDPDPCKEERTFAVCSPLEPTKNWFPISLIWGTGLLEYCRLCTFLLSSSFQGPFRRTQPKVYPKLELFNF